MRRTTPELLRFELNVPVEVSLQNENGITVAGRFGDRVMFTLSDNRRMYVAPFVGHRIRELGIEPGEVFWVCKREVKEGHRKVINWLVERLDKTQLEHELEESIDAVKRSQTQAPGEGAQDVSEVPVESAPPVNGAPALTNRTLNGHDPSQPADPLPHADSVPETQLAHALKTAIAAAADAERFAKALDYGIRFTTEDIRSMGITILIGMQQRLPR